MSTISDPFLKVLVVDDERPVRRYLHASLGNRYTIFEAESGEEALHAAAINHPDVIILDLGLPDMDGTDVTRRLREWTDVPVIVISFGTASMTRSPRSTRARTITSPNRSEQANYWRYSGRVAPFQQIGKRIRGLSE
jgi:CheY-like chemotaxis protein